MIDLIRARKAINDTYISIFANMLQSSILILFLLYIFTQRSNSFHFVSVDDFYCLLTVNRQHKAAFLLQNHPK